MDRGTVAKVGGEGPGGEEGGRGNYDLEVEKQINIIIIITIITSGRVVCISNETPLEKKIKL